MLFPKSITVSASTKTSHIINIHKIYKFKCKLNLKTNKFKDEKIKFLTIKIFSYFSHVNFRPLFLVVGRSLNLKIKKIMALAPRTSVVYCRLRWLHTYTKSKMINLKVQKSKRQILRIVINNNQSVIAK